MLKKIDLLGVINVKNIDPLLLTTSSTVVAILLTRNTNSLEQNVLGNWLMSVGQILAANSAFLQINNQNVENTTTTVDMLEKLVESLKVEIEELKKNRN